jgi:hypothetical protein
MYFYFLTMAFANVEMPLHFHEGCGKTPGQEPREQNPPSHQTGALLKK